MEKRARWLWLMASHCCETPILILVLRCRLVNVLTTGLIVAKGEAIETNMRLKIGFWGSAVTMFMVPIINTLLVKDEGEGSGTMSAMALTLVFAAIIAVANGFVQGE